MTYALQATGLSKRYGQVAALDEFSLNIPLGGVFGLLGPNGAGKSTLFRIALALVKPSAGEVRLLNAPAGDIGAMRKIGAVIETPRFQPHLTATQTLQMLALASGVKDPDIKGWIGRVGLGDAAHRKVNGFSVGMKQRLGLAAALLSRPEALILDEPTSGMDPVGIQEIRALIRELADRDGVTIILASHQLDEVQRVCDRVAIMAHGKLAQEGSVDALTSAQERLRISATPIDQVLSILGDRGKADGQGAALADIQRDQTPSLMRALVTAGVEITEARWIGGDLEQVFLMHMDKPDAG